jgi:hypothetical protein
MNPEDKKQLSLEDPVDPETLDQLRNLQDARAGLADNLLSLEQERIQLLAAARKVDDQRGRLFEKCLIDRGVSSTAIAEIDAKTGKIVVLKEETLREPKKARKA